MIEVLVHLMSATILTPLKTILLEFGFTDVIIEVDFHPLQPIFTIAFMGVSHDDILKAQLIVITTLMVFAEKGFSRSVHEYDRVYSQGMPC